jgi:FkbM family methyltransferase
MTAYAKMLAELREIGLRPGVLSEACIEQAYREVLTPGSNAIDGGASVGRHTLGMSRCVADAGTIFSFEPVLEIVVKLLANMRKQKCTNVCPFPFALSDSADVVDFTVCTNVTQLSSLRPRKEWPPHVNPELEVRKVPVVRLDSAIPGNKFIDFIKLDLEGAEFPAMRGGRQTIERCRPLIVFESHRQLDADAFGYTDVQFFGFFHAINYDLWMIDGRPLDRKSWQSEPVTSMFYFWATPREKSAHYITRFSPWIESAFSIVLASEISARPVVEDLSSASGAG